MPTLANSAVTVPETMREVDTRRPVSTRSPMGVQRSPIMLASLPGIGSGPDAVIRQFPSGRSAQQFRILVPGR